MAFSLVASAALQGLHVEMLRVEADVSNGLPMFHMVGYLSSEVKEAAERVRTAIHNSGLMLPPKKTIINLSPATVKKKGPSFDLPIALSVLLSVGCIPKNSLENTLVIGELSLNGKIRKVKGVLPIVMEAVRMGYHTCILPAENAPEGALIDGVNIIGGDSLGEICAHLRGERRIVSFPHSDKDTYGNPLNNILVDYSDIKGQEAVKRAAEVAVAGGHNLLLMGPPGSGKSMIAERIPTILPPLTKEESMEITKIYSVMGLLDKDRPLITGRPFRSVHHTATKAALTGGGPVPSPGEISLAHGGVLFLDELPEFQKSVLEVLRQPLEDRRIRITRSHANYVFPANFILIAAMNPCPCGNYPDMEKCSCTEGQIRQYLGRVSQPFLDRMDICIEAPGLGYEELNTKEKAEGSKEIRERVKKAREVQNLRYKGTSILTNSMLGVKELPIYCNLGKEEGLLMKQAFTALGLTARTYHKILKVARTIADLDGRERIDVCHLKEAAGYRTIDKKYWGR
ncbi:MAG: YifB family Mg chelatase-like AAA ATPase [Dorea sp.]|nr:YifB family Mg chelatase-like AAA ATPase [Dorea sp.]